MLTDSELILQKRTIREMLSDIENPDNAKFFEEVANIAYLDLLQQMQDSLKAYVKYVKGGMIQPHLLTKFQRLSSDILAKIDADSDTKITAERYGEFVASVFVALEQPINFDLPLFDFLQMFRLVKQKEIHIKNSAK